MRKVREVELKAVKILGFVFAEGSPGTKNLEDSYGIDQVMGFLKSRIEGLDIFLFENESDWMISGFFCKDDSMGCFLKWWVSPNLHTSSHDPFLVGKKPHGNCWGFTHHL